MKEPRRNALLVSLALLSSLFMCTGARLDSTPPAGLVVIPIDDQSKKGVSPEASFGGEDGLSSVVMRVTTLAPSGEGSLKAARRLGVAPVHP